MAPMSNTKKKKNRKAEGKGENMKIDMNWENKMGEKHRKHNNNNP